MELTEGTIIATHGPLARVQIGDRTLVMASRRRLTWEGGTPAAPQLVVGDRVGVDMQAGDGVVVAVRPRTNCLLRRAPSGGRAQVLAANVDQALVVLAVTEPEPRRGLLDRFLVACELARICPIITVNKIDRGPAELETWLPIYERVGYQVLRVSARTGWGLGSVKRLLAGRTTLFCGPSGVGKSSLLNAVYPGFRLKVGSISEATGKGTHTTSTAELMPLPYGGFVVDTPGLKEFGVWQAVQQELEDAFPEIAGRRTGCRFSDCRHQHEPDCAVKEAVACGEVDPDRYATFLKLVDEASL